MSGIKEYGTALFELCRDEGVTDTVSEQLALVGRLLSENPEYSRLLDSPAIPSTERARLVSEAFSDLDERLVNLLCILVEKGLIGQFEGIRLSYTEQNDRLLGILRAEAISASPMSERQLEALRLRLCEKTGKTVILSNKIDPSLIGGVRLTLGTEQLDGSIRTRLERIEAALENTVI